LRGVVDDIQKRTRTAVKLPRGYHIDYGGQFESEARASQRILWLGLGVIAGIFVILLTAFGSSRDALIIMLNLPLALIGGTIGVFVSGGILSVASLIGFITLFGIATRNGIMLISHVKHLVAVEGVTDWRQAVILGASERLAPIFMTAMATGLALVPIALGLGKPGSEIQAPMAIVIFFGLFTSTLLNMIVVPSASALNGPRRPGRSRTSREDCDVNVPAVVQRRLSQGLQRADKDKSAGIQARLRQPGRASRYRVGMGIDETLTHELVRRILTAASRSDYPLWLGCLRMHGMAISTCSS
jgi:hypothetical protein